MSQPMPAKWLAVPMACAALTVSAQTATAPATAAAKSATTAPSQAEPADRRWKRYPPFSDDKGFPWKEANDTVGKVGGWRAYAKEAQDPQTPGTQPPAAAGASAPHAGHGKP